MLLRHFLVTIIFVNIVSTSCKQYGSLTFVIDDTYSMRTEIDLVREAADEIMDIVLKRNSSQIEDIVVVTFNDPVNKNRLRLSKSKDRDNVKRVLNRIRVNGGWDCPEYSVSGIKMALTASKENSYLFVFTDASPKDNERENITEVIKLAQAKGSQVFFFLTQAPDECKESSLLFRPYWDIAKATNGQVFKLYKKSDVKDLINFLGAVISGESNVIIRKEIPANERSIIPFTIDDQTEYVIVAASSSGRQVDLDITKGATQAYNKLTWSDNNKILRIDHPDPGAYEATVKGSSETTVYVFGRTDFTFQHGFSETVSPTFRIDKRQPTEGQKYHLLVKISDPTQSVNINYAKIESIDGKTEFHSLPLRKISDDYYTTGLFLPPNSIFMITIIGEGKKTGKEIKRTAKTPIEPRPRDTDPVIKIQGGGTYKYNSTVVLTCNVKAYPKPVITWKDRKGVPVNTSNTSDKSKYDHISKLIIKNLKHSAVFYCYAENSIGSNSERVDLIVETPFIVVDSTLEEPIIVEFEHEAVLHCNITSEFRMKIWWYHVFMGKFMKIENSDAYSISSDETQIRINNIKQDDEGKYVCKAWLKDDTKIEYQLQREIIINHIAPIMGDTKEIHIKEHESIDIKCDILKAFPKPEVRWKFKNAKSERFQMLDKQGEVLKISDAHIDSTGIYKCIAENDKGINELDTKIIVLLQPQITLLANTVEGSVFDIDYESNVLLTCRVVSHSRPSVIWKNFKNEVVINTNNVDFINNEYTSNYEISQLRRSDSYYCEAQNELGTQSKSVSLKVKNPFQTDPLTTITKVKYGEEATLSCGITSRFQNKTTWHKQNGELIKTSDKYFISKDSMVLKILKVGLDSQGKYICNASIQYDDKMQATHETTVEITGLETPQIEKRPNIMKILRNQSAVLKCNILKGHPKAKITWMVKNEKFTKFTTIPEQGEELTVPSADYQDTGFYKCEASNVIGTDEQTVKLIVEGPPEILSDEGTVYAVEGDATLRIPCIAVGFPKPIITWSTGSNDTASKYNVLADGTLVIKNPSTNDLNNYTCHASNKFGSASKSFEGWVTEFISNDDLGDSTYIDILQGETKQLECEFGILKGRWFRDSNPMNEMGTLTISNAEQEDSGNYTCRVSDYNGSKSHTYMVDVGYAPTLNDPNDENMDWDGRDNLLVCAVSMHPSERTAKVEWFYNGKASTLSSGEILQSVHPIIGWGNYTCKVSNYHGNVTKKYFIHSSGCLMHSNSKIYNSPLVMNTMGTWPHLKVKEHYVHMNSEQTILISCHNQSTKPNTFKKLPDKTEIVATCDHEDMFRVKETTYKLSDLQCQEKVTPIVQETGEKCAFENTEYITVGYEVHQPELHFLEVYKVCFDKMKKVPVYSKVDVTQIDHVRIEKVAWKKYNEYYNEANKEYCVEGSECCATKRHLVDPLDVQHGPASVATFIDGLNTVFYWHGCKTMNDTWSILENKIRSHMSKPYRVLTGAHGYSSDKHGITVPRYLWKMVKHLKTAHSLVIVKVNNPEPLPADIRCTSNCSSWVPVDEYTYCCKLEEFQKAFMLSIDAI